MTALEILVAARKKIESPGSWTQGVFARDFNGNPASPTSISAVCWCSIGALHNAVFGRGDVYAYERAVKVLQSFSINQNIIAMNDLGTQEEVLQCFDKAIESLK